MLWLAVPTEANEEEKGGQMRLPFELIRRVSYQDSTMVIEIAG